MADQRALHTEDSRWTPYAYSLPLHASYIAVPQIHYDLPSDHFPSWQNFIQLVDFQMKQIKVYTKPYVPPSNLL